MYVAECPTCGEFKAFWPILAFPSAANVSAFRFHGPINLHTNPKGEDLVNEKKTAAGSDSTIHDRSA